MALQTESPTAPSAQVVGNAFVEQYYHIIHTSPELAFRFYQESSVMSRPDADGVMYSVETMQGINEKILSMNFTEYKAEIKTADAQKSRGDGVTVLVTGCLMGKDNLRRKFAQSFFLAPQDKGYYVLNDVFRYVEDDEPLEHHPVNGTINTPTVPSIPSSEPARVPEPSVLDPSALVVDQDQVSERANDQVKSKESVYEKEVVVESPSNNNGNDVSVVVEPTASFSQEDTTKISYASIVKVPRGSSGPTKVYVPTNTMRVTPKKPGTQSVPAATAAEPEASAPNTSETPASSHAQEEVEGHSVYVRNLPQNITTTQLELEFKKFGPIKKDGVQVRCNKVQGYCFGFVEFLSSDSMDSAVKASPMIIGGCRTIIEMKRTSSRGGSGRGRFPSGRGGFHSESFRGRGNYSGGGRSFSRSDSGNRGEFSGRGRSSGGRGEGYQQGRGRGRGRGGGRSGGGRQDTTLA